ncbi:MAG: bifunctional ADP-dependent NAD(P)H-hydrate dehydratase/NAD(P)H-hydrate epimerase [Deltaproteobacteria bacterium]|nr:bifunctional ADP-dependent NAD(P)H-hydrate dehydratase/NAD(P)H-hydrate epimerase [Deltaproteobacteria bacterium]
MREDGIWPLRSAAHMRALDAFTINEIGVPADVLMESAGRVVLDVVLQRLEALPNPAASEVVVLCGRGNNGGDGLVVARHLHQRRIPVKAVLWPSQKALSSDCERNRLRAEAAGVQIEKELPELGSSGILVDALFGTGLSRPLQGDAAAWVDWANRVPRSDWQIVSIDLPSGLDSDTGQVLGAAIQADETLALGAVKQGLALAPGRDHAGHIRLARIGIADSMEPGEPGDSFDEVGLWSSFAACVALPRRPHSGHKGHFGHVLLLAGSEGKTGAAALSAAAALRTGSGLVTLGCPASLEPLLAAKVTEAMTAALPEEPSKSLSKSALSSILDLLQTRSVLGLGPGLGTEDSTRDLILSLLEATSLPMVIDADGLNVLGGALSSLKNREGATVLTPHPGEAGRLLGLTPAEINADRISVARRLSLETGSIVLLKGSGTVIADPGGQTLVNPTGGAYLASAGNGDVLTGVITALIGQGLDPFHATALGAYLHGDAGDRLARRIGQSGLLAGEISAEIPASMETLRTQRETHDSISRFFGSTLLHFPEP